MATLDDKILVREHIRNSVSCADPQLAIAEAQLAVAYAILALIDQLDRVRLYGLEITDLMTAKPEKPNDPE